MSRFLITCSAVSASAFLLTPCTRADFLDGRVVNANAVGVPNVNIHVNNLGGGGPPTVLNAGTDANGFFHVTVIPGGTYEIEFQPPQPPVTTDLVATVSPVVINGTADIGTISLPPGVSISGRVVGPNGIGVAGVNLDVVQQSTGANATLIHDNSDALGFFNFASPAGAIELRFDTTPVSGQTLAPRSMDLNLSGDVALGDVALLQGFVVSGLVRGPGSVAVPNCDVDATDVATGLKLYTPGDDSNASGFVDFVVPAGVYNFEFCPPFALHLVTVVLPPVTVIANMSLGIVNLPAGFVLSGHVQSYAGAPVANVDVDLFDSVSGAVVPICSDNTDVNGNYAVNVPAGNFRVVFTPFGQPLGSDVHLNVAVSGALTLDAVLPAAFSQFCFGDGTLATACPCGNTGLLGRGCQNSVGTGGAQLVASGATHADTIVLSASGELASALSIFLQGNAEISAGAVFGDGVRCAGGSLKRLGAKNASAGATSYPQAGDLSITAKSAALGDPLSPGMTRIYQTYYRDPNLAFCGAPVGNSWNVGNAVRIIW